ncbi:hypothetical protein KFL_003000110 [Klebsormidium nitens]|uniref:GDSL esterase/lipase n=1 Tax=Klebsormidium nitens TaxID=105231 RepID=A0A1Y1IET4_KLENI|nr:hypothetical protein KFL_003000110 [Klebsormidium nitens]|eukprot:GAQ86618.1 hypothetical protein KFL_003000110 [Klebsormidium nitens]
MLQPAAQAPAASAAVRGSMNVSALYAFGDSTTDTGLNKYLNSTTTSADRPPYGETYFHMPTGRYSDGRLVVDFLAQAWGFPLLAPYLQPGANFSRGANFASAGSGALNTTSTDGELSLAGQVAAFLAFKNGTNGTGPIPNSTINEAIFLVSTGTNDYTHYTLDLGGVFSGNPVAPDDYIQSVVANLAAGVQGLYAAGARRFFVANVPAVGCAPQARLVTFNDSCLDPLNDLARDHNRLLNATLANLTSAWPDATILVGDTNGLLASTVAQPSAYNFSVSAVACCGAGPNNATLQCGQNRTIFDLYTVRADACADPDTHIFWDVEHGTEAFYRFVAKQFLFGTAFVQPRNLTATFAFPPGVQSRLT